MWFIYFIFQCQIGNKIRLHDLTHSNETFMDKEDVKEKVMQQRLGHSNISTTLEPYTHLFKEHPQDACEKPNLDVVL